MSSEKQFDEMMAVPDDGQTPETLRSEKSEADQKQDNEISDVVEVVTKFNSLPKEEQNMVMQMTMQYSGPLPLASEFKKYEMALPGSADRILTMAEEEQKFRHISQTKIIDNKIVSSRVGQIMGYSLAVVLIGGGFWLIAIGKDGYGIAAVIGSLTTIIVPFLMDRFKSSEKKSNKNKE